MNKEPIGLYIFRFVIGVAMLSLMGMLYWSSTLVENHVNDLRSDLSQLKNDVYNLKLEIGRKSNSLRNQEKKEETPDSSNDIDQAHNLLQEDPFFINVLPKLLGEDFSLQGVQHIATIGKPHNLHPFSNWSQVSGWHNLCNVTLSKLKFGKYETMAPDMAISIEERNNPETGIPEFLVRLRDHVYWQPVHTASLGNLNIAPQFQRKHQVTADDFKFYFDAMMNPYVQEPGAVALRTFYGSMQEIEVIDKLTFIVRWKPELVEEDGKSIPKIKYIAKQLTGGLKPLAGFVFKYFSDGKKIVEDDSDSNTYRTNSVWAQNFAAHWAKNVIISCGPWTFDGMNENQIKFIRNPDFYFLYGALTAGIEESFKDSPDNIWNAFKNNQLQSYNLQPAQLIDLKRFLDSKEYREQEAQGYAINQLNYLARSYLYIAWNQAKPYFQTAKVRQAMTMSIDRRRIIEQNLNGLGIEITGPFHRNSPAYDPSIEPWPFNPQEARRLLEEEGWYDSDGDGIIDKMVDGKRIPFSFSLTYYVKNPTTKSVCEYVATALKEVGIECHLNGVDQADLSAVFDDKGFDALCLAWALGTPPENPRQLWHSSGAKEKGSSNAIGFSNPEIDSIIDKLDYEYDQKKRIELYHRFNAIIHQEQPYTFLYTAKIAMVYRDYLQNVFVPADRQDLVPGANISEPDSSIFWIRQQLPMEN